MEPRNFQKNNRILLMGLNPGGKKDDFYHNVPSVEEGSAYLLENWKKSGKNQLQKQIIILFQMLDIDLNKTLASNFIPFRSQSYDKLPDKKRCRVFSMKLWGKILKRIPPKVILCNGIKTFNHLKKIVDINSKNEKTIPINWGNIKIHFFQENDILLVGLPHLSHFKFLEKEQSKEATEEIIEIIQKHIF